MRKVRLDLDALAVESFETDGGTTKRKGTVHGHAPTLDLGETCNGGNTCWDSCDGVCGTYFCATIDDSCGAASCVYGCSSLNPYGCNTCNTCQLC
jgi:hypothetical protein